MGRVSPPVDIRYVSKYNEEIGKKLEERGWRYNDKHNVWASSDNTFAFLLSADSFEKKVHYSFNEYISFHQLPKLNYSVWNKTSIIIKEGKYGLTTSIVTEIIRAIYDKFSATILSRCVIGTTERTLPILLFLPYKDDYLRFVIAPRIEAEYISTEPYDWMAEYKLENLDNIYYDLETQVTGPYVDDKVVTIEEFQERCKIKKPPPIEIKEKPPEVPKEISKGDKELILKRMSSMEAQRETCEFSVSGVEFQVFEPRFTSEKFMQAIDELKRDGLLFSPREGKIMRVECKDGLLPRDPNKVRVRVKEDLPAFMGIDQEVYKLQKGDVLALPKVNADLLIKRGVAELIEKPPVEAKPPPVEVKVPDWQPIYNKLTSLLKDTLIGYGMSARDAEDELWAAKSFIEGSARAVTEGKKTQEEAEEWIRNAYEIFKPLPEVKPPPRRVPPEKKIRVGIKEFEFPEFPEVMDQFCLPDGTPLSNIVDSDEKKRAIKLFIKYFWEDIIKDGLSKFFKNQQQFGVVVVTKDLHSLFTDVAYMKLQKMQPKNIREWVLMKSPLAKSVIGNILSEGIYSDRFQNWFLDYYDEQLRDIIVKASGKDIPAEDFLKLFKAYIPTIFSI